MKRGNENAQQRREDYEAQDDDDDDGSNVITPKGPFAKASDELLKSRRILRVRQVLPGTKYKKACILLSAYNIISNTDTVYTGYIDGFAAS